MNEDQYIKNRLDDQITWYSKKSVWNQKWYKRLHIIAIVAAVTIPFLSGYMSGETIWMKFTIGLLGFLAAAIIAVLNLYQFQENWIEYRTTCESLKHEKYLYLTKTAPYDGEDAFPLLVEQVETLFSRENTNWSRQMRSSRKKDGSTDKQQSR